MPLAQAHPFEPMPVTHEEEMQEVSQREIELSVFVFSQYPPPFAEMDRGALTSLVWLPCFATLSGSEEVLDPAELCHNLFRTHQPS